jgi:hypothetical protein
MSDVSISCHLTSFFLFLSLSYFTLDLFLYRYMYISHQTQDKLIIYLKKNNRWVFSRYKIRRCIYWLTMPKKIKFIFFLFPSDFFVNIWCKYLITKVMFVSSSSDFEFFFFFFSTLKFKWFYHLDHHDFFRKVKT